jgi:hypothetical protein
MKKSRRRRNGSSTPGKIKDRAQIAAELAPVEEANGSALDNSMAPEKTSLLEPGEDFVDGTIVLDHSCMQLPSQIAAPEDAESGPHPVFLVVIAIALGFVAFIAYLIHLENY